MTSFYSCGLENKKEVLAFCGYNRLERMKKWRPGRLPVESSDTPSVSAVVGVHSSSGWVHILNQAAYFSINKDTPSMDRTP